MSEDKQCLEDIKDQLENLLDTFKIVEKMYEYIRIVEPITHQVIVERGEYHLNPGTECFGIWENGKCCKNCISMRAINENESIFKIGHTSTKIFLIMATPIEVKNRKFVLEMFKDATKGMIFENESNKTQFTILRGLIDDLNYIALHDSLTGLYNRRFINERLPVNFDVAKKLGQNLSIIMADIDFFKEVNDTYGHAAGDSVLKSFAEILLSCIHRESDWVARFGGEEFLICLPGAGLEKTHEIAEQMRKQIEAKTFTCGTHVIKVTASFGICNIIPSKGDTLTDLIEYTDKALYKAKRKGRNRVEWLNLENNLKTKQIEQEL